MRQQHCSGEKTLSSTAYKSFQERNISVVRDNFCILQTCCCRFSIIPTACFVFYSAISIFTSFFFLDTIISCFFHFISLVKWIKYYSRILHFSLFVFAPSASRDYLIATFGGVKATSHLIRSYLEQIITVDKMICRPESRISLLHLDEPVVITEKTRVLQVPNT